MNKIDAIIFEQLLRAPDCVGYLEARGFDVRLLAAPNYLAVRH